jgi:hypothetical protein
MKTVCAEILWYRVEDGGREKLPSGPQYSTVARFPEATSPWQEEAWSVVACFEGPADSERKQRAQVRFLAEDAPHGLLHDGARFDLYEGRSRVATVTILE